MHPEQPAAGDPRTELDALRSQILAVDAHMGQLMAQRQALVVEYERRRFALSGWPPPLSRPLSPVTPAERQEWSGARVRALLLSLGATLLGLSALTFTAVAWSRMGDGGRALLLLAATTVVTALAIGLRRSLPATAEAFAGLAIVLVLVDAYAGRRAGLAAGMSGELWWAIGTAAAAGFAALLGVLVGRRTTRFAVAALLPMSAELLIVKFADAEWAAALGFAVLAACVVAAVAQSSRWLFREGRTALRLHAGGSWAAGLVLAAIAAGQPGTVAAACAPALAMAALSAAPALARRAANDSSMRALLGVLVCASPAAAVLTLLNPLLDDEGMLATSVLAGGATALTALVLPAGWRAAGAVAGGLFALPGTLWSILQSIPALLGPLGWFADPWTGSADLIARGAAEGPGNGTFIGSWSAIGTLGTVAAVGLVLGISRRGLLGITTAAVACAAALGPLNGESTVLVALITTTSAFVLALLGAALVDREQPGRGWALLPGAAIAAAPMAGWAAVSATASVSTLAVGSAAGAGAALLARPGMAREFFGALAGALAVTFAGVATSAAGAGPAAGGFAAAIAAGAVLLAGLYLARGRSGTVLEITGAAAALCGTAVAAQSTPWLAGTLTALVPVTAVAALRPQRRVRYGSAAGVLALCAVWAWLAAGHVEVVEAYTAPAAAAALAVGILMWRNGPGRSWLTLGPALVLAIGPTMLIGMVDDDLPRLISATAMSLAAVIGGAGRRLQAPLILGAGALLILAIDQWGDEIVRMPRWITVGVAGVLLMWIGATFERRRQNWRRASEVLGGFG